MRRLLTPLSWYHLRFDEKRIYLWYIPIPISIILTIFIFIFPARLNIFGEYGLVHGAAGLLQILAGFYIAALAAVATFDRDGMDEIMSGKAAEIWDRRKEKWQKLTRRRFLCLILGFLAISSIVVYLMGMMSMIIAPAFRVLSSQISVDIFRILFIFIYSVLFCQILITTAYAFYYLVDRIHRGTPRIVTFNGHATPSLPTSSSGVGSDRED